MGVADGVRRDRAQLRGAVERGARWHRCMRTGIVIVG